MKSKIILIIVCITALSMACKKEYEKKNSATYPISGDWYVMANYLGDDYGPYVFSIYNTAFGGADTVWVDDNAEFWTFKVKAKANVPARTFEIDKGTDVYLDDTTTIMNGRIIGNDSIHFLVMFASSPGDTIIVSGHRKTGFE